MSRKSVILFACVCLIFLAFTPAAGAQDKPKDAKDAGEFKVPPEDAKKTNPLKSDASTIAEGKKLFGSQCALCHGKDGDGERRSGGRHEAQDARLSRSRRSEGQERRRTLLYFVEGQERHARRRRPPQRNAALAIDHLHPLDRGAKGRLALRRPRTKRSRSKK